MKERRKRNWGREEIESMLSEANWGNKKQAKWDMIRRLTDFAFSICWWVIDI